MALVNFSVCLFVFLHHISTAYMYEANSKEETGVSHTGMSKESGGSRITASESYGNNVSKKFETKHYDVEVRCYCNTAQCVGTGYMCLSTPGGGCYSEVPAPRRTHHARHGCLHHLADTPQDALSHCQNSPGGSPNLAHSLLLCCFKDLCNHEDSPQARARLNVSSSEFDGNVASERGANFNGEVWFKAATIAVPVCGALILFLLVAVAVRLLKADALLHADRKLRGGYMSPLSQNAPEDVKKVWVSAPAPLLVTAGGQLVPVERATLLEPTPLTDIQR